MALIFYLAIFSIMYSHIHNNNLAEEYNVRYHNLPNGMRVSNTELQKQNKTTHFSREINLTNTVCELCTYPLFRCQCDYIKHNTCACELYCNKCAQKRLHCDCTKTTTREVYERDSHDESEYDSDGYKYYTPSYSINTVTTTTFRYPHFTCVACSKKTICKSNYGDCKCKCGCGTLCDSCEKPYYNCGCKGMYINGQRDHSKNTASFKMMEIVKDIIAHDENKVFNVFSKTNITTCAYLQLPFVKNHMITYANSSFCATTIGKISQWKNRFNMILSNVNKCIPDEIINLIFTYLKSYFYRDNMASAFYEYMTYNDYEEHYEERRTCCICKGSFPSEECDDYCCGAECYNVLNRNEYGDASDSDSDSDSDYDRYRDY